MSHAHLAPVSDYESILDELESLSREHLLFYRIQIGRVLLNHFWGDDAKAASAHRGRQAPHQLRAARDAG